MRDTLVPSTEVVIRPYLGWMGLAVGASPEASTRSSDQTEFAGQVDPHIVIPNAAAQKSLRLASGQATARRLLQLVRAPATVAFDERRVPHFTLCKPARVPSLAIQPGDTGRAWQTLATLGAAGVLDARNGLVLPTVYLFVSRMRWPGARALAKEGRSLLPTGRLSVDA